MVHTTQLQRKLQHILHVLVLVLFSFLVILLAFVLLSDLRVRSKSNFIVGPQEPLPATVRRRKLALFEHVTRHDSLSKIILQGTLEGGRRRGRQRKCWMDNIKKKKRTSLLMSKLTMASCRKDWERISAESSPLSPPPSTPPPPRRPNRPRD